MGIYTEKFNFELKNKYPEYERQQYQTFLTAPEWRNVEMAEEFAEFLSTGNPFYQFHYFSQIQTFWQIYADSFKAANKYDSARSILFSEYTLMNTFIGTFTSIGFAAKGILSTMMYPFSAEKNDTEFQKSVGNLVRDYAAFIHHTPFYNYAYFSKIQSIWESFISAGYRTNSDYTTFFLTNLELISRGMISAPVGYWYNQPENKEFEKISLIIKTTLDPKCFVNFEHNIEVFEIKEKNTKNSDGTEKAIYYAHCSVPRYEDFQKAVRFLLENDVVIKRVAGQENIQVKVDVNDNKTLPERSNVLYHYQNHINKNKKFELEVKTKDLGKLLHNLDRKSIPVSYIHDF